MNNKLKWMNKEPSLRFLYCACVCVWTDWATGSLTGRGGTCGLWERVEMCIQERDHVEDLAVDGKTILQF